MTSTQRIARWRRDNPERAKAHTRRAQARYRARKRIERQADRESDLAFTDRESIDLTPEPT
jgi:hypothetical protein